MIRRLRETGGTSTTFDELMQAMAVLVLNSPGGARPALTPEQQAAKARVDQIGKQACSEVVRNTAAGETVQAWGTRVHTRFNQLIEAEANPKLFPETVYLNGQVESARLKGSSLPDAVWGASRGQPEMLFDLKTGLKLIEKWWVTRLGGNLPVGYTDVPVFRVTC